MSNQVSDAIAPRGDQACNPAIPAVGRFATLSALALCAPLLWGGDDEDLRSDVGIVSADREERLQLLVIEDGFGLGI